MGIRFSPGPCGCCGFQYIAVCKLLSSNAIGGGALGVDLFINGFNLNGPAFGSLGSGHQDAIVSQHDLQADATQNVFLPGGAGLPLDPAISTVGDWSNSWPLIALPWTVQIVCGVPIAATISCEFSLYSLRGSKGGWTVIGHASKTASSGPPVAFAQFNVDTNGGIT